MMLKSSIWQIQTQIAQLSEILYLNMALLEPSKMDWLTFVNLLMIHNATFMITFMVNIPFSVFSDCQSINFISEQWVETFSTESVRTWAAEVQMSDYDFWILGGNNITHGWVNSTEICSTFHGCASFEDLPEVSYFPKAVRVSESQIFVLPNNKGTAWLFNQDDNSFEQLPNLIEERQDPAVGFINGHEVVVAGGARSKTSEIFDLDTNEWRLGPELPVTKDLCCASSVQFEDSFLIVGGRDNYSDKNTILKLNPVSYEWETLPQNLESARTYAAAILVPSYYVSCT